MPILAIHLNKNLNNIFKKIIIIYIKKFQQSPTYFYKIIDT